jgi:hypothetical protein
MRSQRALAVAALLALLLPLAAAAAQLCVMPGCAMQPTSGHDCCPPPASSVQAGCCDEGRDNASLPARADGGASVAADIAHATAMLPAPSPSLAMPAEPAATAARELLTRHCVLRI